MPDDVGMMMTMLLAAVRVIFFFGLKEIGKMVSFEFKFFVKGIKRFLKNRLFLSLRLCFLSFEKPSAFQFFFIFVVEQEDSRNRLLLNLIPSCSLCFSPGLSLPPTVELGMSDSKRSSKSDLNESNMPLLDEEKGGGEEKAGETPEKEQIEMGEKEDGKKKKKEKKEKKPKEKKEKGPGCIQTMSNNLNVKDRDDKSINVEIDVSRKPRKRPILTQPFGNWEKFRSNHLILRPNL